MVHRNVESKPFLDPGADCAGSPSFAGRLQRPPCPKRADPSCPLRQPLSRA